MVREIITKRITLITVFMGLLIAKMCGHNSSVDDGLLLIIAYITYREVLSP